MLNKMNAERIILPQSSLQITDVATYEFNIYTREQGNDLMEIAEVSQFHSKSLSMSEPKTNMR
jgi:hypothetical protein